MLLRTVNTILRLATRVYVAIAGLAVVSIFALMGLSLVFKGTGSPGFNALIHADGFFPWPVATMFWLMGFAPAVIGIGFVGGIAGALVRRRLLGKTVRYPAQVMAIRQTGGSVNGRPRMSLDLKVDLPNGPAGRRIVTTIDLAAMPRVGDRVSILVSQTDPNVVVYGGLVGPTAGASAIPT
jgi:hypothetical protein